MMGVGSSSLVPEAVEAIVGVGVDLAKCADNAVDPRGGLNEWPCFADSIKAETGCSAGRIGEQGQPLISTKRNTRMQPMTQAREQQVGRMRMQLPRRLTGHTRRVRPRSRPEAFARATRPRITTRQDPQDQLWECMQRRTRRPAQRIQAPMLAIRARKPCRDVLLPIGQPSFLGDERRCPFPCCNPCRQPCTGRHARRRRSRSMGRASCPHRLTNRACDRLQPFAEGTGQLLTE